MNYRTKIEQKILKALDSIGPDDKLGVIVKLKEPDEVNKTKEGYVTFLKDNAQKSQHNLISYLERKKSDKIPIYYKNFFLLNCLFITAPKKIIESIAKRRDVLSIEENRTYEVSPIFGNRKNK